MVTSSVDVGTWPPLQLLPMSQKPLAVEDQDTAERRVRSSKASIQGR
jgi:hypothetical protein